MRLFLTALCLCLASPAIGQNAYTGRCNGQFSGIPLQGQLTVDYLIVHDTYRYHGVFFAQDGTRVDFEVDSNQNGGVGGAWINGARHRAARIEMRYSGKRMVIANLDTGGQGQFVCQ